MEIDTIFYSGQRRKQCYKNSPYPFVVGLDIHLPVLCRDIQTVVYFEEIQGPQQVNELKGVGAFHSLQM